MRLLETLRAQTGSPFEVVVVDNCPTTALRQQIEGLADNVSFELRYVAEARRGSHHARHSGADAATGAVLAFVDDDMTVGPGWVDAYVRAFADHPEMAAAGGPVHPAWEVPPPRWLSAHIGVPEDYTFALRDDGTPFTLSKDGYFFSNNMAIRIEALFETGGFNPDISGASWVGDGDTGLNRKLCERGALIGYVPEALAFHHIPATRMTLSYLLEWSRNSGIAAAYTANNGDWVARHRVLGQAAGHIAGYAALRITAAAAGRSTRRIELLRRAAFRRSAAGFTSRLLFDRELRRSVAMTRWIDGDSRCV